MIEFETGKEGPRQIPTAERLLAKLNSADRKEETFRQLVLECLGVVCDRCGQMVLALEQGSKNTELIAKALEELTDATRDNLAHLKRSRERVL